MKTLNNLKVGQRCIIKEIGLNCPMLRRFTDIGLITGTVVECVGESPAKNPKAYLIRSAVIAIRDEDCTDVFIELLEADSVWD